MNLPDPKLAIYPYPLTVLPETPLLEVLAKMNQVRGSECNLVADAKVGTKDAVSTISSFTPDSSHYKVTNCALVVEEKQIKGIVTERDVVKLVAIGKNLSVPVGTVMTKQVITLAEADFKDVFVALSTLRQYEIRHLPITDNNGNLIGIVTSETIRRVLQPINLLAMRRVVDVMTNKVIHVPPSTSVLNLARIMAENRVSCIVITHTPTEISPEHLPIPIGIVTERDIVQLQILGLSMESILAGTVMSQPLFCMQSDDSLWLAHQEMQRRFVRRLVVTGKQGELVGIITQTNIMRALDPVEMYGVIETLQEVVDRQTTELIQTNEQLQIQSETVRKALEKEQALNQMKSQFISMISHEFRNPLTGILGLADLLLQYEGNFSKDKKTQYLNCIHDSAYRMLDLVRNLLLIGKSEAINLEINSTFLNLKFFCQQMLREMELYENTHTQHQFILFCHGEENTEVFLDEKLLRHILTNLLSNASKYSLPNSKVILALFVESDRAIFKVQDEGIGIPTEAQERLFELFYRADNVGSIPGTGLGLAIVKKYVDLLNGEINIESKVGVGTTITVKIPLLK